MDQWSERSREPITGCCEVQDVEQGEVAAGVYLYRVPVHDFQVSALREVGRGRTNRIREPYPFGLIEYSKRYGKESYQGDRICGLYFGMLY